MSTKTYDTLEGSLTVRGTATASRAGATNAVALVGGYDSSNAASGVTAGESTRITTPTTAEDTFGDSELSRAAEVAASNGVGSLYGVPVAETSTTENFTSSSSGTLSNTPLFDPRVHPDHSIDVQDDSNTDISVTIVYDDSPSTPSDADTININPINGEWVADASDTYDITYTYGDYGPAIEAAADLDVRNVVVLTESPSVKSTLQTELSDRADDFDFLRGFTGATPEISAGSISGYSPDVNDWRIVEVAPARADITEGNVRTAAAVGAFMAAQPIGPDGSGLFEDISGIESLNTAYRQSEAKDFSNVTVVTRSGEIAAAETTSTESQFGAIYKTEIIDAVGLGLFSVLSDYAGGPQDVGELRQVLGAQLQGYARGNPPLLNVVGSDEDPYEVSVSLGNDVSTAEAAVSIVPFPVAETVNLDITVADGFVQFAGAN